MGSKVVEIVITYMDGQKARIDKATIIMGNDCMPMIELIVGMNQHYIFPLCNIRSIAYKEDKSESATGTGRYPWSK